MRLRSVKKISLSALYVLGQKEWVTMNITYDLLNFSYNYISQKCHLSAKIFAQISYTVCIMIVQEKLNPCFK